MPIDRDRALSADPTSREITWATRDVLLYHLSVGAGAGAPADPALSWTFEKSPDLAVLPTFAVVAGSGPSRGDLPPIGFVSEGVSLDLRTVLHGAQAITVHQPLPAAGSATVSSRISDIWDKGKAAVVVTETSAVDSAGRPLWTASSQVFARGEGGFGGPSGPASTWAAPERAPDEVITTTTRGDQALLYRLNGDDNPLHIDPSFAALGGFDLPILHGLASYGIVARGIVERFCGGDPRRLTSFEVRFAGSVTPGQTIVTSAWRDGDEIAFASRCPERGDAPVLSHARATVAG